MLSQLLAVPADLKGATSFEHIVNLVGIGMRMRLLLLARLKTVQVTEHARRLDQVHLLHLLLIKCLVTEDLLGIHTILHTRQRVPNPSESHSIAIVANLSSPVYV